MRISAAAAVLSGIAAVSAAQDVQSEVAIDLSGVVVQFPFPVVERDSVNDPVDGTPEVIVSGPGYEFSLSGNITFAGQTSPIGDLFELIEPGQERLTRGFVPLNEGGLLPEGETVIWRESFGGEVNLLGIDITISIVFEAVGAPDGTVTFRVADVTSSLGFFTPSITINDGQFLVRAWEPTEPQFSEWRFDGSLDAVENSSARELRFMDDAAFGTILGGLEAPNTPDAGTPFGVTEAQSSFVDTADDPAVPPIGGVDRLAYLTSPARNLAIPTGTEADDARRGLGLALFAEARPDFPGEIFGKWTMVWDILIPSSSWYADFPANTQTNELVAALVQTNHNNVNGADFYLRIPPSGENAGQLTLLYTFNADDFGLPAAVLPVQPDQWFRLAVSVDEYQLATSRVFVDGVLVGTTGGDYLFNALDPRDGERRFGDGEPIADEDWNAWGQFPSPWALSAAGTPISTTTCLFSDLRFGGSEPVYLANLGFVDRNLGDADIAALGGPDAAGIFDLAPGGFAGCNPADVNEDGLLNFGDVSAFIAAFNEGDADPVAVDGDAGADTTGDGLLNFGDVSGFIGAFNSGDGCP